MLLAQEQAKAKQIAESTAARAAAELEVSTQLIRRCSVIRGSIVEQIVEQSVRQSVEQSVEQIACVSRSPSRRRY